MTPISPELNDELYRKFCGDQPAADYNRILLPNGDGLPGIPFDRPIITTPDATVVAFFGNHEAMLVEIIRAADLVVGCVAWLTSRPILKALAGTKGVSLVIQKEDFLRPERMVFDKVEWAFDLRDAYAKLPELTQYRHLLCNTNYLKDCSTGGDPSLDAVRCIGTRRNRQADGLNRPGAHHKFIVLCRSVACDCDCGFEDDPLHYIPEPFAVWTGSFNFINNSQSLDNAVFIEDARIAGAYYDEWDQVASRSESLDWRTPYVSPGWRIGT